MKEVISHCPVCHKPLTITKLSCRHCNIEISGDFSGSRFSQLKKEELDFVEAFVIAQGNIKEMERIFKVSYPTIKKTLESIINQLNGSGGSSSVSSQPSREDDILEKIKNKEISVDQAVQLLKGKR